MSMSGCQWGHVKLRCASRAVRVLGEVCQASGDLYDDSAQSNDDGGGRKNNCRTALKLLGESEIETILQRLGRLTQEEAEITAAQTLGVVHGLVGSIKVVMEGA